MVKHTDHFIDHQIDLSSEIITNLGTKIENQFIDNETTENADFFILKNDFLCRETCTTFSN